MDQAINALIVLGDWCKVSVKIPWPCGTYKLSTVKFTLDESWVRQGDKYSSKLDLLF